MNTTRCLALLALLALVTLGDDRPTGPRVGTTPPSAIVDNTGRTVGGGPPLDLLGPAPEAEPTTAPEHWMAALQWLHQYFNALARLERELTTLKIALRRGFTELKDLRDWANDLARTRDGAYTDNLRDYCIQSLAERRADIDKLVAEQEAQLAGALKRWDEMEASLRAQIADSAEFPDYQKALTALRTSVGQRRTLSEMELLLAAGKSAEFRAKAEAARGDDALAAPILLMRATDYLDRGEGRAALYAARLGMERYPDNQAFRLFVNGLDVSYLKMISARAAGDGEAIHKAWNDYAGTVSDSAVKQFFFGGLTRSLEWMVGRADALEQLQATGVDRAVMEHNGIELMVRLRERGLSFEEIRGLSAEALRGKLREVFGDNAPLSDQSVLAMSLSLRAAFRNQDVERLLKPNKQQFDVDMGNSYYGTDEFDQGFLEYAVDAINVKNVILFCGPGAVLKYAKVEPGMLAQLAQKAGVPQELATMFSSGAGATTVRDWVLGRPSISQALKYLGTTTAGQTALRGLETARYLRYDASGPVRVATGVAEAAAQMLMFEVGGKVGQLLGGDVGEFVGQALVMLAGNPVADLQAAEQKALAATAEKMAAARTRWEATNRVLNRLRAPVHTAAEAASAGRGLAQAERQALQTVVGEADDLARSLRNAADAADSPILQNAADEAAALSGAGRASLGGNAAAAGVADDIARQLEQTGAKAADQLDDAARALERASSGPVAPPPPGGPRVPGTVRYDQATWVPGSAQTQIAPWNPAPPPPPPPTRGQLLRMGDDALRARDFAAAEAHFRNGLGQATDAGEQALLRGRVREARQAARFARMLEGRAELPAVKKIAEECDEALKPFTQTQRQHLGGVRFADTAPLAGSTGGPRRVLGPNGETLGIWKPCQKDAGHVRCLGEMNADGRQIAEVMNYRLGRRADIRVPYAEPMVLPEFDAAGRLIAEHPGVIVRYVPHSKELSALTPGCRAALADQIAQGRPLQVMMGNYDVHMGNYRVDRAGRVWFIDAGESLMATPGADPALYIRRFLGPDYPLTGDATRDWTRLFRDWYAQAHPSPQTRLEVSRLDDILNSAAINRGAAKLEGLSDDALRGIVESAIPRTHPDYQRVLDTMRARRDALGALLQERWPRGGGGQVLLFDRRQVVRGELRPAA